MFKSYEAEFWPFLWQGEEHDYEEVGGRTILIYKEKGDIPSK